MRSWQLGYTKFKFVCCWKRSPFIWHIYNKNIMEPWAIILGTNFLSPYVNSKIYEADKHPHNMRLSSLTRGWHFSQGGVGSVILPDSLAPASPWRWCVVPAYWPASGGSGSHCSRWLFWQEACDASQCIYTFPARSRKVSA